MDYDDVIRAIKDLCTFHETGGHEGKGDDATCATVRAAAPILAEYGARLMREAGTSAQPSTAENPDESAYERGRFDGIMEYGKNLGALDPATIVREAVK